MGYKNKQNFMITRMRWTEDSNSIDIKTTLQKQNKENRTNISWAIKPNIF